MDQYNRYSEIHELLTMENYDLHKDEIELIEILIDEYEDRTMEAPSELAPVELIASLLDLNNLSKSQLAKDLGVSKQLITDILNYRRNISKTMVLKLADRFKIQQIAFSKPYKLKIDKKKKARQTA